MTDKQRAQVERVLMYWAKGADRYEAKMNAYEAANETDKAAWADAKNSECITAANAIQEVLGILGYSVRWTGEDGNTALILE